MLIGLLLGGLMVCLFASLSMEAVGRAGGAVVEEVRRQFREHPGIMEGTEEPDYATCVDIVTKTAQREMILPSLLPIGLTLIVGLIDAAGARRPADRRDRGRLLLRRADDRRRRRVGQRQEADRGRRLRGQGLGGPRRVGHRRHGRRPFKDTAGPAINPMIKVANIVAILIIPLIT